MSLPPGPDLPPWKQVQAWIEAPVTLWTQSAADFGDMFTLQLGTIGPTVLFSDPSAVREIFQLPTDAFECRQYNEHYKYVMGEQSLLVSDGVSHSRRRRLLLPSLHRQPAGYAGLVSKITQEIIDTWPRGEPFLVRPSLHVLSLRVVLEIVFGPPDCALSRDITRLFTSEIFQDLGTWRPWARFGRLQPLFRELISRAIRLQREHPDAHSTALFPKLVFAQDEEGQCLSEQEIQDHIFTLLIAGVDPAAIALAWALYWIHNTPGVKAKLAEELSALGSAPDPQDFVGLPYLGAVCNEALRMYPVVPTPSGRKLTASRIVAGHSFEAGITLLPCTYLVHRRECLYAEADAFRPERFLERRYAFFEYFPFGGGSRLCIGAPLAMLEMKIALATILRCCNLELACQGPVAPVRHGTLLAPSDDMRLTVTDAGARQRGRKAAV